MLGTEILGLIILPNILNSVTYVELLRNNLPDFLKDIPLLKRNKIIFPDLWISFSGATARNYFIYKTLPEDTKDLETRLRYAVWVIKEDVMENVQRNLLRRMQACIMMMVILNIFYKLFFLPFQGV